MKTRPQLADGETIDDTYVIRGLLGTSATAEVYAAHDRQLHRDVAIKVARPDVEPRRLRTEGRLLSAVQHPGVVGVHRLGVHRGRPYLALERLVGTTLEAHLDVRGSRHRLPLEHGLELFIQLADVVAALHRCGVVHRDLNPGHVMITPDRGLVIFDLDAGLGEASGSRSYLAPELLGDAPEAPAIAQDIYALGCIGYELLSGRAPWSGESRAVRLEHPAPELPASSGASPLLARVIRSMLARLPDDRPGSAEVIASWLRGVQRGLSAQQIAGPQIKVLIADDDPDIRALLATLIERRLDEVAVRTVADGFEALSRIAEQPIDVLLLDLDMPRLSGLELCMHLAGMPESRDTALCVISSHVDPAEREVLARLGVRRFIDKGTAPGAIIATVEEVVAAAQSRRGMLSPHGERDAGRGDRRPQGQGGDRDGFLDRAGSI